MKGLVSGKERDIGARAIRIEVYRMIGVDMLSAR